MGKDTAAKNAEAPLKAEFERMLREKFSPEGREERIARSLAALREAQAHSIKLTPEEWKMIAEDDDFLDQ